MILLQKISYFQKNILVKKYIYIYFFKIFIIIKKQYLFSLINNIFYYIPIIIEIEYFY